ncbi:hypothetical protein MIDIC_10004 [Alphaproteobacteria bacterium]
MFGVHEIDRSNPLVIVEGIFDTLNAKAKGIENVVAWGGSAVSV